MKVYYFQTTVIYPFREIIPVRKKRSQLFLIGEFDSVICADCFAGAGAGTNCLWFRLEAGLLALDLEAPG